MIASFSRPRPAPIGLHLSARSAGLVQLAGGPDRFEIQAMAHAELPHCHDAPPHEQDRETAAALRRLIAEHPFKGRQVVSCLGSQELFVQNVRLPQMPAEEIEQVVKWEAEERLPYPLDEAEIRHLPAGQVRQDSHVKQEVILLACRREAVNRHVGILEQAGLLPAAIDVEPCALLRCLGGTKGETSGEPRRGYLNLGDEATTVLFAEGGRILFLKCLAPGGRQLDEAVARQLDLPLSEAAAMRALVMRAETLEPDNEIHRSVIDAIRSSLETIGTEIELCLRYYKVTFRGKPLEKFVLTGGDAAPWLTEFLGDRVGIACELGRPFDVLTNPESATPLKRPGQWTTALGLALR